MPPPRIYAGLLAAVCLGLGSAPPEPESEPEPPAKPGSLHDDFEGEQPTWRREQADAVVEIFPAERSELAAHDGRRSERLRFKAGAGSALYFSYALPKIPIDLDPKARLFVKGNQAGVQLFGRVVLPADTDPETGQPTFVLVAGARYDAPGRWQRLDLAEVRSLAERQAQVLRASGKRKVSLQGAYLERLVINALGAPGDSEVFLDDLTVAPLPAGTPPEPAGDSPSAGAPGGAKPAAEASPITLDLNRLQLGKRPWFASIASAPDADPRTLAAAGFRVWDLPAGSNPETARRATEAGLLLMPELPLTDNGRRRDPAEIAADAATFPEPASVAFWSLGHRLGEQLEPGRRKAELDHLRDVKQALLGLPPGIQKLTTGEVAGDFYRIANKGKASLDIFGVHPPVWGSMTELGEFQTYLAQRRTLTAQPNPEMTYWAMIDAAPPEGIRGAAWGSNVPPGWARARVQPEQVRLMAYAALAAGYRGWGVRGDAELSEPAGRAMLNELAFLNAEMGLIESILARGKDPIQSLLTYPADPVKVIPLNQGMGAGMSGGRKASNLNPAEMGPHGSIRAAVISTADRRGQLLLLNDYAGGAQFQPPQLAFPDLRVRVPGNESAHPYLISLGKVEYLNHKRVPGGLEIALPEFGPTAMVLLTHDLELVKRIEAGVNGVRSKAIMMAIEQSQAQLQEVEDIHRRLVYDAHDPKDSDAEALLKKSADMIRSADEALRREDYPAAWDEARRATRPLRMLMRSHFEDALFDLANATRASYGEPLKPRKPPLPTDPIPPKPPKGKFPPTLVAPISSPPLVAFETLPRQYLWNDWIRTHKFGPNKIKGGSFEGSDVFATLKAAGWSRADYPIDGVVSTVVISADLSGYGKPANQQMMWFKVRPARAGTIDERVPFMDQPPVTLVSPPVRVLKDEFVRISINVAVLTKSAPGAGGVFIRDSIGGEPLQFRTTDPMGDWKRVVLYRQVPADTDLTVTLGLAGFGDAFMDDLRIERLGEPDRDEAATPDFAEQGRRRPVVPGANDAPTDADLAGRARKPAADTPPRPSASLPEPTRRVR